MEKLEINQQDQAFVYQVGKDIAHLQDAVAALQAAATAQQGKKQWVQKVTLKSGTTESWAKVKVNPELVRKPGIALLADSTLQTTCFKEFYEMPADASLFPAYLIALVDPKQVDFVSEVG